MSEHAKHLTSHEIMVKKHVSETLRRTVNHMLPNATIEQLSLIDEMIDKSYDEEDGIFYKVAENFGRKINDLICGDSSVVHFEPSKINNLVKAMSNISHLYKPLGLTSDDDVRNLVKHCKLVGTNLQNNFREVGERNSEISECIQNGLSQILQTFDQNVQNNIRKCIASQEREPDSDDDTPSPVSVD